MRSWTSGTDVVILLQLLKRLLLHSKAWELDGCVSVRRSARMGVLASMLCRANETNTLLWKNEPTRVLLILHR